MKNKNKKKSKKHKNDYKLRKIKLSKADIFYQTNDLESTTGAKYHFAKLLLRDSLFGNGFVYQQALILTFTWRYLEKRSKFYQKMSTDGASV